MTEEREICYQGKHLLVTGKYKKEIYRTHDHPGEPAEFEIDEILFEGLDVMDFMSPEMIDEINEKVLDTYE
jgi:hypothetical protein